MRDTTTRGDLSELEVMTALVRAGRRVLRPVSSGLRYDLAIDNDDGTVVRVQCKTGILARGRIIFRVCSTDARRHRGVPYHGQVHAFGVYCPQTQTSYLVPMSVVADCTTMGCLRVDQPKNGQSRRIRYACDYEIVRAP
jgi:hypothetical protein